MVKFKTQIFYIAFLGTACLTSCKPAPLIPGFPMGLNEKGMNAQIKKNVSDGKFTLEKNDSNAYNYNWKISDTSIYTRVSFNHDGLIDGKLRITVVNLSDSMTNKDVDESLDEVNANDAGLDDVFAESLGPTKTHLFYFTCPKIKLDMVLLHLHDVYGKEDSITVDRDFDNDTLFVNYHFHDKNSQIVLRRGNIHRPSVYIPFSHISRAYVYQLSKSYDSEFNEIRETKRKQLKPADIISVPISYRIEKNVDKYGYEEISLPLTIDISVRNRHTLFESRRIRSMKGSIVIKDGYGELLESIDNIEYDTHDLNSEQPGILHALGDEVIVSSYSNYRATLNLNDRTISPKFKAAVIQGQSFGIEFVPNAIKFSDGTILKD